MNKFLIITFIMTLFIGNALAKTQTNQNSRPEAGSGKCYAKVTLNSETVINSIRLKPGGVVTSQGCWDLIADYAKQINSQIKNCKFGPGKKEGGIRMRLDVLGQAPTGFGMAAYWVTGSCMKAKVSK